MAVGERRLLIARQGREEEEATRDGEELLGGEEERKGRCGWVGGDK